MATKSQQPEKNRRKKLMQDLKIQHLEKKPNKKDYYDVEADGSREIDMAKGGRAGFKVGGAAKRGISKILRKK